ncbi:MAG: acyl-ACP--UDP-N-acetylglucosamine O-acyltransferase [Kiloniellales bacterium]
MADIHPTAIVEKGAELAAGVRVGPFCVVGSHVRLAEDVVLHSHVVVAGRTTIGARSQIYAFASIGNPPQDLKYRGEASELIVGSDTTIREYVTMNPGTEGGGMVTRIGERGFFMIGAHVAHDCQVGNQVIMSNHSAIAGHVILEDNAILGGHAGVHQFVRIGRNAMVGGMTGVDQDVIPYGLAMGERARLLGLNVVGLRRNGLDRAEIQRMNGAVNTLFNGEATLAERVATIAETYAESRPIMDIVEFVKAGSSRPLCQPKDAHAP